MAEKDTQSNTTDETQEGSIDYGGSQSSVDKAKAKAHEADAERLRDEHETS